jgi:hypothetical protein
VLVPICCVPQLWKSTARNLKDYPYTAKFKCGAVQWAEKGTAKLLQSFGADETNI